MLTIKMIHDAFGINPKVQVNEDNFLTTDDIAKGNIFPSFSDGSKLINIRSGLTISNDEVYLCCPKMKYIEIDTDDSFMPCGGKQLVIVQGVYQLYSVSMDGVTQAISEERRDSINALVKIEGDSNFTYEKPYLVNPVKNDDNAKKECLIHATYYFNGSKYQTYKTVTQGINSYSSWLLEKDETQFITITLKNKKFASSGGTTTAKVERSYTRFYYKADSCGNKVDSKVETGLVEDITSKSFITVSSDKAMCAVLGSTITVFPQPTGAPERVGGIVARYMGFEASTSLFQEKGDEVEYKYTLTFDDTLDPIKYFDLDTSLETFVSFPIKSNQISYLNGEDICSDVYPYLTVTSDSDWVKGSVYRKPDNMTKLILGVDVVEANHDKLEDREATITISNEMGDEISLVVYQSSMQVVDNYYTCETFGGGTYTTQELTDNSVYCEIHHMLRYEDGTVTECLVQPDLKAQLDFKSDNNRLLNAYGYIRKDNKFYVTFINESQNSVTDIDVVGKLKFTAPDIDSFTSDTINIKVKGNDVVNYNYEFCFDEHSKFKSVSWDNNVDAVVVNITSVKYKMVNGKTVEKINVPYKTLVLDENGKPVFDDTFSVKAMSNNNVLVFPVKTDNNVDKIITLRQAETNTDIALKLSYVKKLQTNKVKLKVTLYNTDVDHEIWTDDKGFLLIDESEIVKLSPCWLHPTMKKNYETVFEGDIELTTGKHHFETYNIYAIDYIGGTRKPCKADEIINVDTSTDIIELKVKL